MPRANRYHLAGYVWHITQRCHRKQFLLKVARDRRAWIRWLYEALKRGKQKVVSKKGSSKKGSPIRRPRSREKRFPSGRGNSFPLRFPSSRSCFERILVFIE